MSAISRSSPPTLAPSPPAKHPLRHLAEVRWGLLLATLLLAGIGLATVNSASAELSGDYLYRQGVWIGVGMLALLIAMSFDYHILMDLSPVLYGLIALALVLVLFFGAVRGGAKSWLGWGSFGGQPSELMKVAAALLLGRYLAGSDQRHLGWREIGVGGAIIGVPMVLVALEPDLGGAAMFLPLFAGTLLVAGLRARTLGALLAVGALLGTLVFFFGIKDYQRQRILTYFSPGKDIQASGYQIHQSKIAVGSGQLSGRGYMQGTQSQLRFLPERHTDFIFAVLAEEWGFLGVATVLGLYAWYFVAAASVAVRARDRAGILLVVGLLSTLAAHVLYNTAMVVGLLPVTGVPLPFLSYGGSFTLVNFAATGLILSVDLRRHVNR